MADIGWQELMIILVVILFVFGAGKLPEVAKSLGQGVKEFRNEANATSSATLTTAPGPSVNAVAHLETSLDETLRAGSI